MTQNSQPENLLETFDKFNQSFDDSIADINNRAINIASILGNISLTITNESEFKEDADEIFQGFINFCTNLGLVGTDLARGMNQVEENVQDILDAYVIRHSAYKELENIIAQQDERIDLLEEEIRVYKEFDETITDNATEIPPVTLFGRARAWFKNHFGSPS